MTRWQSKTSSKMIDFDAVKGLFASAAGSEGGNGSAVKPEHRLQVRGGRRMKTWYAG
jgi:hypothetical protein